MGPRMLEEEGLLSWHIRTLMDLRSLVARTLIRPSYSAPRSGDPGLRGMSSPTSTGWWCRWESELASACRCRVHTSQRERVGCLPRR